MVTSPTNTRSMFIFDGVCTTAMYCFFVGLFLAAFSLALGANHWEIGFISAIAFLSMPMQIVGLYTVDRWKQRRALIVLCALTAWLLWIVIVCLPFVREEPPLLLLLTVLICIGFIAAIEGPAWHFARTKFDSRRFVGGSIGSPMAIGRLRWWADFEVVGADRDAMVEQIGKNVFAAGFQAIAANVGKSGGVSQ